jgi:hypothetical protein
MKQADLDALQRLPIEIEAVLPHCGKLKQLIEEYEQLLEAIIQEKLITIKDVCCRICSEWQPAEILEGDKSHTPSKEEALTGLCYTHGNDITHDAFTPWHFFCPDHPFFKRSANEN